MIIIPHNIALSSVIRDDVCQETVYFGMISLDIQNKLLMAQISQLKVFLEMSVEIYVIVDMADPISMWVNC